MLPGTSRQSRIAAKWLKGCSSQTPFTRAGDQDDVSLEEDSSICYYHFEYHYYHYDVHITIIIQITIISYIIINNMNRRNR